MLTYRQKKTLFKKIGEPIARRLELLKNSGQLQYKEIAIRANIPQSRISEILKYENITEPILIGFLRGGIVNVNELIESIKEKDLTEQEKNFLESFAIHEDGAELSRRLIAMRRLGHKPLVVLNKAIELLLQGKLFE